jgi:sn-glycerol 3-phosphate transport system ATP-binding protein
MNFLPARREGAEAVVGDVRVPLPPSLQREGGETVTVGVRPEHLVRGAPSGPLFRFKVDTVEALGADSLLHGVLGDHAIVARVEGHVTPQPGEALSFGVMHDKVHFFDSASGKRLAP